MALDPDALTRERLIRLIEEGRVRRVMTLLAASLMIGCAGNSGAESAGTDAHDERAAAAAEDVMAGPMADDPHLRLTAWRPPSAADSARGAEILTVMRRELDRYRDLRVARADGFRQYIPGGAAPVQHYTKIRWAMRARRGLDPARPTSLLYRVGADGSLELVGAMFTAPPGTPEDDLDARLPLSLTRWHQHINWCLPPFRQRERWRETRDGRPVFGPRSPIATREACDAVGGRFHPRLLGWMVHVMAFADGDPWGRHEAGPHRH